MTQEKALGRYTILRELGRGAIGAVHAARDQTTGASVALKTLDPALLGAADAKLTEVFLKNARAAARLRHASIVQVYDAGEAGGTAWVAMELLEGESLRRLLEQRPLSIARAVRIFDDIASALAYAHEEGMLHRGIKPSNIMVLPSGAAKIGDFGTGQVGDAALRYMSPEQVRGSPVDRRSDLFSLGAVFYEMLTRRAPFGGDSPQEIRQSILRADPPPPSELNPLVPGTLDRMVLGLLTLRPDGRPADARVVLRDLHRVEEGLGLESAATITVNKPAVSAPPVRPEPAPAHSAPPPRIPRPSTFGEAGDFGGFRPGAADADTIPDRPLATDQEDFDHRRVMMERARRERPSGSRVGMLTALGLMLLAVGVGFGGYMYFLSGSLAPTPAVSRATAPPPVAETSKEPVAAFGEWKSARPQAAAEAVEKPAAQKAPAPVVLDTPRPIAPPPVAKAITEPTPAPAPAPAPTVPQAAPPRAETPRIAAATPKAAPVRKAQLILAVSPGSEVYINGENRGTTPETTTFDLEPGMHQVEIRSGSRKPFVTYITVEAGQERRIRHDFAAKPSAPPG